MRGVRNLIIALVFSLVMPVAAFGNGISCSDQATLRSTATGRPAIITFVNNSRHTANIYWIDYAGKRAQHFYVTPGSVISRNSLVTHPWVITDDYDNCIGVVFADPSTPNVEITDSGIVFSRTSGPPTTRMPRLESLTQRMSRNSSLGSSWPLQPMIVQRWRRWSTTR
jgi:hypothetical protein